MKLTTASLINLALLGQFEPEKTAELACLPPEPQQEIRQMPPDWGATFDLNEISTLFIYGLSPQGEEFLALRPWLQENESRTVVFLADDFAAVRSFLETSTATEFFINPQVILKLFTWPVVGGLQQLQGEFEWFFKTFSTGKTGFASLFQATPTQIERTRHIQSFFKQNISEWLRTYRTFMVTQREVFESYYPNILELLNAQFGQGMFGACRNMPAIICGAGPSLGKHLDALRALQDKALIFGSGSGLNVLSRHGILPHFAGGVDPTSTQGSRLSTNFAFQVPFFYLNRFNHEALRFVQGEKLFTRGGVSLKVGDWFDEQLGLAVSERIPAGMSTSNYCLEVAGALGCNPIILLGMDLSYKEDARYAPGVTAHPAEERKHHQDIVQSKAGLIKAKGLDGSELTTTKNWLLEAKHFNETRKRFPDTAVWNATEGGMPIEGIPNTSLDVVVERDLKTEYDFDAIVHTMIQRNGLGFIKKDNLKEAFSKWGDSLKRCKQVLTERLKWLSEQLAALEKDPVDVPVDMFSEDLKSILGETPAWSYCLEQLNDIFNGLNGKEHFRMAHYPGSYPAWKCAQVSGVIETERSKFLLSKLEEHIHFTENALQMLPEYPMLPRSPAAATSTVLVETEAGAEPGDTVRRFFYLTGELYAIKRFRDGKAQGKQEYYFIGGSVRTVLNYSMGCLDGEVLLFYPGGRPKRELHFACGELDGVEKLWNEAGLLIREAHYVKNRPVGTMRSWHSNGVLAREVVYHDSSGSATTTEWDERGIKGSSQIV